MVDDDDVWLLFLFILWVTTWIPSDTGLPLGKENARWWHTAVGATGNCF